MKNHTIDNATAIQLQTMFTQWAEDAVQQAVECNNAELLKRTKMHLTIEQRLLDELTTNTK